MTDLSQQPQLLAVLRLLYTLRAQAARVRPGRLRAKRQRSEFYERAWRDAAAVLGAEVARDGEGWLEVRLGERSARVRDNYAPLDPREVLELAGDKPRVYGLLAERGLPIPAHAEFRLDGIGKAVRFLESAEAECVVKPARGTGAGRGVITGIRTREQLARAAAEAAVNGPDLVIERQVEGDNFRLLYLDGELIDAIIRRPPTVTGDGASSILQLIRRANSVRLAQGWKVAQVLLGVDTEMRHTLESQGLSLRSVPARGEVVRVKTVINDNVGLENVPARDRLCDEVIQAGAAAAAAVGSRLAGVDVITPDPGVPLERSGGIVLEVNTTPGYYYHYYRQGDAFPVAVHVLRRLLVD